MKIKKNTVPSVTYELVVEGEVVDQTDKSKPLTFLMGAGSMIPGFERQLEGLEKGDKYEFSIQPEEGYGEVDQKAIVDLPKDVFVVDGVLKEELLVIGNEIPMQDNKGNQLQGTIVEIGNDTVKMDFNHQLAGKVLNFTGEVIDVREASEDEINHGHLHGPEGHQH